MSQITVNTWQGARFGLINPLRGGSLPSGSGIFLTHWTPRKILNDELLRMVSQPLLYTLPYFSFQFIINRHLLLKALWIAGYNQMTDILYPDFLNNLFRI